MDDRGNARHRDITALNRQLDFWRERVQVAGSSCRSGVQREYAARQVEELEQLIATLVSQSDAPEDEVNS